MGLIGLVIGLVAAAFGILAGLIGAAFGIVGGLLGLLGPLTPVLIIVLGILWLTGGQRGNAGYTQPGGRR